MIFPSLRKPEPLLSYTQKITNDAGLNLDGKAKFGEQERP
jgi:hypothetical protein